MALLLAPQAAFAAEFGGGLLVPLNRSTLVTLPSPASEVLVADPDIADVHVHDSTHLSLIAKKLGRTNIRIMDKQGEVMREFDAVVGYDLPAIRKALKHFLPDETIAVEMVNTSVALSGQVRSAATVDKAIKIAREFIQGGSGGSSETDNTAASTGSAAAVSALAPSSSGAPASDSNSGSNGILNFMQVTSGQQVMLRVRVGEIQRSALKSLGVDLNAVSQASGTGLVAFGTGGGIASLVAPSSTDSTSVAPGVFLLPGGQTPTNTRGVLAGRWQPDGPEGNTYAGLLKALEQDGLFKVLAEPNLVAISGEQTEFLSGGEIPIPVVQGGSNSSNSVSIEYKPFGVAVKFTPFVLSESRIRMTVQPEVSQVSNSNAVQVSGFTIPSIDTRRAKTTVELAPGESFMIAGLINDQTRANISQLPGVKELPVLGALFRSTEFQRNETELVIAVTPYVVDPLKSSDMKLPTDDFRPPSQMEMFFFGALGALGDDNDSGTQAPAMEGPTGFIMD